MFVRPITQAEADIKYVVPQLIPQLNQDGINDGRYFEEAKLIASGGNLYNYNRKIETTEMPRHAMGYDFIIDRTMEKINPARAIPNPETPAEVLAKMAVPDLPPKMFGM